MLIKCYFMYFLIVTIIAFLYFMSWKWVLYSYFRHEFFLTENNIDLKKQKNYKHLHRVVKYNIILKITLVLTTWYKRGTLHKFNNIFYSVPRNIISTENTKYTTCLESRSCFITIKRLLVHMYVYIYIR